MAERHFHFDIVFVCKFSKSLCDHKKMDKNGMPDCTSCMVHHDMESSNSITIHHDINEVKG
jgi:hypothetical protein